MEGIEYKKVQEFIHIKYLEKLEIGEYITNHDGTVIFL